MIKSEENPNLQQFIRVISCICNCLDIKNGIGGLMVNLLAASANRSWFEHRWSQTKDYTIGI